ncbi:hypothetical protein [Actinoplanes sp. HUAS TT8]|uniref:hypothetical protein n=1 Tax=Actinoplanes sp. HUAS TT8 TaxID=3447453 RepID=UPI003F522CA8
MRCEVCGLDNDPSLDYCDNCENELRESPTAVISPRQPAPRPAAVTAGDYDDDETPVQPGFQDRMAEPRPLGKPVLVGVAVLALAGAIGGVVLASRDGGNAAPAPTNPPLTSAYTAPTSDFATTAATSAAPVVDRGAQGAALDRLLVRSKQSRDKLTQANGAVFRCSGLAGAIARLREVGTERNQERADLKVLDLSGIPNGEAVRGALDSALAHSLNADKYYVKWAQQKQANGCRDTSSSEFQRIAGDDESQVAGTAKVQFLSLWNPVAGELGLPVRDRQGI